MKIWKDRSRSVVCNSNKQKAMAYRDLTRAYLEKRKLCHKKGSLSRNEMVRAYAHLYLLDADRLRFLHRVIIRNGPRASMRSTQN